MKRRWQDIWRRTKEEIAHNKDSANKTGGGGGGGGGGRDASAQYWVVVHFLWRDTRAIVAHTRKLVSAVHWPAVSAVSAVSGARNVVRHVPVLQNAIVSCDRIHYCSSEPVAVRQCSCSLQAAEHHLCDDTTNRHDVTFILFLNRSIISCYFLLKEDTMQPLWSPDSQAMYLHMVKY